MISSMDLKARTILGRKRCFFLFIVTFIYVQFKRTYYKHTKTQAQSFFKENKPATETSSSQCPLVALRLLIWRSYTANCKRRRGASASCHKRKNSSFRWATELELNWQSILVKSGQCFETEYFVTLDLISAKRLFSLIEETLGNFQKRVFFFISAYLVCGHLCQSDVSLPVSFLCRLMRYLCSFL